MVRKTIVRLAGLVAAAALIAFVAINLNLNTASAQTGNGNGNGGLRGSGIQIGQALINAVMQATNLTQQQLMQDLQNGQTLEQIVKQAGADPAAVQAVAKDNIITEITQAVQAGKITQKQADRITAQLDTILSNYMTRQFGRGPATVAGRILQGLELRSLLVETAKATNLSQQQVVQAVNGGQTLAQVASAHNADATAIVTAATTDITNQVNTLVKNGRLTQDQANQLTANLNTSLTQLMNANNPLTGAFGRGNGRGPGRGFGGLFGNGGNNQGTPQPTAQPTAQPTTQATASAASA